MVEKKLILLNSYSTNCILPKGGSKKSNEDLYSKITTAVTPFLSKKDLIDNCNEIYLSVDFGDKYFDEESSIKILKFLSNSDDPNYQIHGRESKVILRIKPENFDTEKLYNQENYPDYIKKNLINLDVLSKDEFEKSIKNTETHSENDSQIVIILKRIDNTETNFNFIKDSYSEKLTNFSLIADLGVIIADTIDRNIYKEISKLDIVEKVFLQEIRYFITNDGISNKQINKPLPKIIKSDNFENKPNICIIDTGIDDKVLSVKFSGKLDYLSENILNHGTQVAGLSVIGEDLILNKSELVQQYNLISFKLSDGKVQSILEGLISAINSYSNVCKIFVLSYNEYYPFEASMLQYLSRRLDYFLNKKNICLITSVGNISEDIIDNSNEKDILEKFPILFPSNCKNVFSVGSLLKYGDVKGKISSVSRKGLIGVDLETPGQIFYNLKPSMFFYGGGKDKDTKELYEIPTLTSKGIILDFGTSFSSGLVGNFFLNLVEKYPLIINMETYRAIMINLGLKLKYNKKDKKKGELISYLSSFSEFNFEKREILMYKEGLHNFREYKIYHNSNNNRVQKAESIKFFINSEKIEKIQFVLIHSNNYFYNPYSESHLYYIIRVKNPKSSKPKTANWSTFGKNTNIHIAEYNIGRVDSGYWEVDILPRYFHIPEEKRESINLRWGLSIKIIVKEKYKSEIDSIYAEIKDKLLEINPIINIEVSQEKGVSN